MKPRNYSFDPGKAFDIIVSSMKSHFEDYNGDFVIGISGGIDSALVAFFAVESFGKSRVHGILLPSNTTSEESINLGLELCKNLGIESFGIPIGKINDDLIANFEKNTGEELGPIARGNISARLRMVNLMAASNEFGWQVLNTGNRTEAMLGYCTLYGDSVGVYSPIGDVFKTEVYRLAEYINLMTERRDGNPVIPSLICTRPATAELVAGQTDEKEIGTTYPTMDRILWGVYAQDFTPEELACYGFSEETIRSLMDRVERNAFKQKYYAEHPIVHPQFN